MFEKINLFYFIISFCIGIILVNVVKPQAEIINKFPTKYNIDNTVYTDKSGNCFKYNVKETNCPLDKTLIKEHPIEPFVADYNVEPFTNDNLNKVKPLELFKVNKKSDKHVVKKDDKHNKHNKHNVVKNGDIIKHNNVVKKDINELIKLQNKEKDLLDELKKNIKKN